ncbi:hypothetical protein MAR_002507, partial [Mya arenaria]
MFLMAPYVANFQPEESYSPNPWTFSTCSVAAFKDYLNGLGNSNCLRDHGDYFDKEEWDEHQKSLPGEIYSLDQQCSLILGNGHKNC